MQSRLFLKTVNLVKKIFFLKRMAFFFYKSSKKITSSRPRGSTISWKFHLGSLHSCGLQMQWKIGICTFSCRFFSIFATENVTLNQISKISFMASGKIKKSVAGWAILCDNFVVYKNVFIHSSREDEQLWASQTEI